MRHPLHIRSTHWYFKKFWKFTQRIKIQQVNWPFYLFMKSKFLRTSVTSYEVTLCVQTLVIWLFLNFSYALYILQAGHRPNKNIRKLFMYYIHKIPKGYWYIYIYICTLLETTTRGIKRFKQQNKGRLARLYLYKRSSVFDDLRKYVRGPFIE